MHLTVPTFYMRSFKIRSTLLVNWHISGTTFSFAHPACLPFTLTRNASPGNKSKMSCFSLETLFTDPRFGIHRLDVPLLLVLLLLRLSKLVRHTLLLLTSSLSDNNLLHQHPSSMQWLLLHLLRLQLLTLLRNNLVCLPKVSREPIWL